MMLADSLAILVHGEDYGYYQNAAVDDGDVRMLKTLARQRIKTTEIPIAPAASQCPTSRDFVPWRFRLKLGRSAERPIRRHGRLV
jgi:hypothetical protein